MLMIFNAKKKLYLCYQKENLDLYYYTMEFNARAPVCKEAGGEEGTSEEVMKLVAGQDSGKTYCDNLVRDKGSDPVARADSGEGGGTVPGSTTLRGAELEGIP